LKNSPEISVLMTAYNAERFIGEAVESVLQQTWKDFEFIIINDGSTDRTGAIIESFDDPRIRLIRQENMGIAASLNKGLQLARSTYIARFDADDICHPQRLEKQLTFFHEHPDHILVGSDVDVIDASGNFIYAFHHKAYHFEDIQKLKPEICAFIHSTVCYHREAVLKAGGYDENAHTFEDHVLWRNLIKIGKAANMKGPLVKMRFSPDSVTIDETWRGKRFNRIKRDAIHRGNATPQEGAALLDIIRSQDNDGIKKGSYYALIGKKYLWNNYNPKIARQNFRQSWKWKPRGSLVFLWILSFMPRSVINYLYRWAKEKSVFEISQSARS